MRSPGSAKNSTFQGREAVEPEQGWMDADAYRDERKLLVDAEREAAATFDKYLIMLSAGTLALSITFLKDIAPKPNGVCHLCTSWAFLAVSLFTIMISFLGSQHAMRRQRRIIDADALRQKRARGQRNVWAIAVTVLNWASVVLFALGVVFMVVFASMNLLAKGE
jgi:hypothetical protein